MVLLLSAFDSFVPFVKLLIHLHGFFDFIIFQKKRFSSVELALKNCKFCLNFVIVDSILAAGFFLIAFKKIDDLFEISCLCNISKSTITMLSDINVLSFKSHFGKSFPVSFSFVR